MTLVLRYVNKEGKLIEQFLSTVHAKDTTALSLQKEIHSLLLEHSLSRSQIRGHGYDGAILLSRELLREDEAQKLEELLVLGKVDMESGQNQELGLQRPGDTHWGYYVKTVRNFIALFSSIIHVLEVLANEGAD
ncbi:uncharacterized protein LOC142162206 [Nicotiana tabacum]|uniref:Uncharacterized protein LOC142162206 n=1 Tax=Nicotiana tabacum TaxID=4097 RepID=A0AC58RPH7_TOBAC